MTDSRLRRRSGVRRQVTAKNGDDDQARVPSHVVTAYSTR